jgi:DNA-binding beta-propeller fold protein YncE
MVPWKKSASFSFVTWLLVVAAGCSDRGAAPDLASFAASALTSSAPELAVAERGSRPFSLAPLLAAPAGDRKTALHATIDGVAAAVLPNGRLVTPAGTEATLTAPKPYGLAITHDGKVLATVNSGASRFSIALVRDLAAAAPAVTRIDVNSAFMGIQFSPDGSRFYAAGGENGNVWVGDTAANAIVGSVNLNGPSHPIGRPWLVTDNPTPRFKGAFTGNLTLTVDGRYLYVVDQGSFRVHVIDTSRIIVGVDEQHRVLEPDNFAAVAGSVPVGRYPYNLALSPDGRKLLVANVGMFQYAHLTPANPVGDSNADYPLCYPGAGYPDETELDRTIAIKKVDPRNLAPNRIDPDGIRCGYVPADQTYTIPGLGDPNAPQASSVYVLDITQPAAPRFTDVLKPGILVGEDDDGIPAYGGSHPNAIAVGAHAIYVANGLNDSISIFDRRTLRKERDLSLAVLPGLDRRVRGVLPVALRLSPDERTLYVAEAGINAVGVLSLEPKGAELEGHIPVGWWPSSLDMSADGVTLYVANSKGRGAGPNVVEGVDNSPKHATMGTVSIVPVPSRKQLAAMTARVLENNGFLPHPSGAHRDGPIPSAPGVASRRIEHVIFINKENATHDLLLGDITATRRGVPVDGEPSFSLGVEASPNHHELALQFAFSDNFYLEPSVSSDGHRWLTGMYTTEFEETHWPASYGGQRRDSGDDPAVFLPYPGRVGFTDANASPAPDDYNEHGGIYLHLYRNGKTFVNFGNGFEFALVDEDGATEPTGIREHANVPMEKIVRDNSDHLFPEFNTHIPDAPLPEDPGRFSRYGRFQQVFEAEYVDRAKGTCQLPNYVDLYYPNDHGGGANDINPSGPPWSFPRFVQDNDAALGLTVDLVSHSPCWKNTVIFVVEDDTQNGLDHVDGFRSIFLAISPWVKHEHVSKVHASLASIFKSVNLIFGLPPLNQGDAAASDLRELFTSEPDFTPYDFVSPVAPAAASAVWTELASAIDFSQPDADEVRLRNAIVKSAGAARP